MVMYLNNLTAHQESPWTEHPASSRHQGQFQGQDKCQGRVAPTGRYLTRLHPPVVRRQHRGTEIWGGLPERWPQVGVRSPKFGGILFLNIWRTTFHNIVIQMCTIFTNIVDVLLFIQYSCKGSHYFTTFKLHVMCLSYSFDCNIVEADKQLRAQQHCWNVQDRQEKMIHGLMPGMTYR